MKSKRKSFSPSVNIQRDSEKDFEYVVTPNAIDIYQQIVSSFKTGIHSFSIVGSYGTGKSSFLVALKRNLRNEQNIFEPLNGEMKKTNGYEFDLIVGRYDSLIRDLALKFDLNEDASDKEVLKAIKKKHDDYKAQGVYWFIILDEFGKYLEYAAKNNTDKELYFIQQLSEYANEEDKNLFFINTLHQAFDSYAFGLDFQQRKEWDKVKGRLRELTFNEPVEQLLYIAGQYLKRSKKSLNKKSIDKIVSIITEAQVFPLKNRLDKNLANSLYPLDPISAATLALSLQTYGQNERSLFSFLNSDDEKGINNFDQNEKSFYNVANVFDYLIYNHHSYLSSKYNPHYVQWNALKKALERTEMSFKNRVEDYTEIIKIIGLLNIFSASGSKLDTQFLRHYLVETSGTSDIEKLLEDLVKKNIIKFRKYKNQFILFEGTDYDVELELKNASQKIDVVENVVPYLRQHFSLPHIPAKESFYRTGSPRFFKFIISEQPTSEEFEQPVDGLINLVFGASLNEVKSNSLNKEEAVFYGVFSDVDKIRSTIFEIHKIEYLLKTIESDKVAEKELKLLHNSHIDELNDSILDSIYSSNSGIDWVFKGEIVEVKNRSSFNKRLSQIIDDVYHQAPVYKNELINKHKVSPAVYKPRKDLLRRLMSNRYIEDLGFTSDSFPAEKTIYLSLLNQTGLHRSEENVWDFYPPNEESELYNLWNISEDFFESTKSGKKPLVELIRTLAKPPIGLKNGLIELWIPIYIIIKSNDCALYYEESYVPELTFDMVNLVYRNPKLFEIKAFEIDKKKRELFNKYRAFQNLPLEMNFSNKTFVETIRPFLLSYNELNEYGRSTNKISEDARKLRDVIKTATDPEKAFFESFPQALGYTSLQKLKGEEAINSFIEDLNSKLYEIEHSYDQLIRRIEEHLLSTLELNPDSSFEEYVGVIQKKYQGIKKYKLADYQNKLLNRLLSNLADREKWLSAVALAVIDKPISRLKDRDEDKLFYNLETRLHELDNLLEISKKKIDIDSEEAFKLELTLFGRNPINRKFKISKEILKDQSEKVSEIKKILPGRQKLDIAILLKLIEEISNNE